MKDYKLLFHGVCKNDLRILHQHFITPSKPLVPEFDQCNPAVSFSNFYNLGSLPDVIQFLKWYLFIQPFSKLPVH